VPGHISNTAGTYLCNQLFYLACAEGRERGIPAGFIHVPDTPQSAAAGRHDGESGPSATMELATMRRGLLTAVSTCLGGTGGRAAPSEAVRSGSVS